MRFCLIDSLVQKRVHYVEDDSAPMTFCGQFASFKDRYSRRAVSALQGLPICKNCLRANG